MSRDDDAAAPADFLTLVMPLTARAGMTKADFYDYWLNAHVTMPARFPGISSIWLHAVSFEDSVWPRTPGVSHRPPPEDEFQGVPEAAFVTEDGLAEFQAANKVQMDDGINFLQEIITYLSLGNATETVVDRTGVPAPDGHDGLLRHLLFLRRSEGVTAGDFRRFRGRHPGPGLGRRTRGAQAAPPPVRRGRAHPRSPRRPDVQAAGPPVPGRAGSRGGRRRRAGPVAGSPVWSQTAGPVAAHCAAVHAARVSRCITTKYRDTITLAGIRGWPWPTSSGASEPAASSMTRSARCSSPTRSTCSSEGSGKELRRDLTSPPQCGRHGP